METCFHGVTGVQKVYNKDMFRLYKLYNGNVFQVYKLYNENVVLLCKKGCKKIHNKSMFSLHDSKIFLLYIIYNINIFLLKGYFGNVFIDIFSMFF